ncbi:MAG: hypothetical protein ACK5CE_07445 [Actinomycetes bacterium]
MILVRLRTFLARHRAVHWTLVASAALAAGALVATRVAAVERERLAWGESVTVWVADAEVAAGGAVAARRTAMPLALVPDGALTVEPAGATALRTVGRGEVLTHRAVGDPRSLVGAARRAVAVPADDTTLPVEVGDRVAVVAAGAVLATGGVVVEVRPTVVVVAVDATDGAAVASASLDRLAVLVRHG